MSDLKLNTIKSSSGARQAAKRVGRGIGSGLGKTCGRGHKGQKSRSGGFHKIGFEGGQTPIHRRMPKSGFTSRTAKFNHTLTLTDLERIDLTSFDIKSLVNANIINKSIKQVKIIATGKLTKKINVVDIKVSQGAKEIIEKLGGKVDS